jgi:hypothetical protein
MSMKLNWGWRIAIVYTFFAVSTMGFVVFAMSENVELVRKDYYEESLRYDATFASTERGNAIFEQVTVNESEAGLEVRLPAAHVKVDSASVNLYRAENSSLDRRYKIEGNAVHIPQSALKAGNYQAQIEWRFDDQWYRVTRPLLVTR